MERLTNPVGDLLIDKHCLQVEIRHRPTLLPGALLGGMDQRGGDALVPDQVIHRMAVANEPGPIIRFVHGYPLSE